MPYYNAKPELQASDSQLVAALRSLQTFDHVADMLEITPKHLHYLLFKIRKSNHYKTFEISKKNGGTRKITAPTGSLKILQEKLNKIFSLAYKPNITTHGFIKARGIVTNATVHVRKRHILNFDIENFFPSINLGRVRGVLKSFFKMGDDAATIIANICCYDNALPQGAPTSPILSNMVCFSLDKEMRNLAKLHSCDYTRYADDITFSTTRQTFPKAIGYINEEYAVHLGAKVEQIIEENGFVVNNNKTRLNNRDQNLSVTGLTVNKIVNVDRNYIKKIRAILRCIEKYSLQQAQSIYEKKLGTNNKGKKNIFNVVRGMITYVGHVKGKQDPVYEKLARRYNRIAGKDILKVGEAFLNYWSQNVCVIEVGYIDDSEVFTPEVQGTGFFLKDVGFVTNWHVVRGYIEMNMPETYIIQVHRSRYNEKYYKASVRQFDEERDIAILNIDGYNSNGFESNSDNYPNQNIKVIGYPNYGHKDSLYVDQGIITQYRRQFLEYSYNKETGKLGLYQERIVCSARIVYGNSGGPVINTKGQVIGIATKGFSNVSKMEADDDSTAASHVVKIGDVFEMLKIKESKQKPSPAITT